jgi:hypothetical protein
MDVPFAAGEEIVDRDHIVAIGQQTLAKVRAEKAGTAGDKDAHRCG